MSSLIMLFNVVFLLFLQVSVSKSLDEYCDKLWQTCDSRCTLEDSNPEACILCCDMSHTICLDNINNKNSLELGDKFEHCFDRDDYLFSSRLDDLKHERNNKTSNPQPKEDYTFEHGKMSLSSNVLVLDGMDYLDCSEADLSSIISYIKLDYNEFTFKIKIGSIIVMNKEYWLSLSFSNHCQHAPASKVIDIDIISNDKNSKHNYLLLKVIVPQLHDYFDYLKVDIPQSNIHTVPDKQDIKENKPINNGAYKRKNDKEVYTCWFIIDGKYAVKQLDVSICEHYIPLQEYLLSLKNGNLTSNDKRVYFGKNYTSNIFNNGTSNNKEMQLRKLLFWNAVKKFVTGVVGWVKEAADVVGGVISDGVTIVRDSIKFVETLAGDVLEVMEEIGDTLKDIVVQFGEDLLEGISGIIEFFENIMSGTINLKKVYGIWIDNEEISWEKTVSDEGSLSIGKYFDLEYNFEGTVSIESLITMKFGGVAGLYAEYSIIPPEVNEFKFYVAAGFGFESSFDVSISAIAELVITGSAEKSCVYWIGPIPIVIDFYANIGLGISIETALAFQFHTGIGEYSQEYGIKLADNGKLELYKEITNTLSAPSLDFAYEFVDDGPSSCFTMDIVPTLQFDAGIKFYKIIDASIVFPITGSISLEYPSTSCDDNACVSGEQQKLGIDISTLTIDPEIVLSIDTSDDDIDQILDILGIDGFELSAEISLGSYEIDLGSSTNCIDFNFDGFLQICCGNNFVLGNGNRDETELTMPTLDINGEDIVEFDVGLDYPLPDDIYVIKSYLTNEYLYWDKSIFNDIKLSSTNDGSDYNYWRFVFGDELYEYAIVNLDYKQTLATDGDIALVIDGSIDEVDSYEYFYKFILNNTYDDNNAKPLFQICSQMYVSTPCLTNTGTKIEESNKLLKNDANINSQLFYIEIASEYQTPEPFIDHFIISEKFPNSYVSSNTDGEIEISSLDNGWSRWIVDKLSYEYVGIFVTPSLIANYSGISDIHNFTNNAEYILCWSRRFVRSPTWDYVNSIYLSKTFNKDYCSWNMQKVDGTNSTYYLNTKPIVDDGDTDDNIYQLKAPSTSSGDWDLGQGSGNRYKFTFDYIAADYDLPLSTKSYYIKERSSGNYLTSSNDEISLNSLTSSTSQQWNFEYLSDMQSNLVLIKSVSTNGKISFLDGSISYSSDTNDDEKIKINHHGFNNEGNSVWTLQISHTNTPTDSPTLEPTLRPSDAPSLSPTAKPTNKPTNKPTSNPASKPTSKPTSNPTVSGIVDVGSDYTIRSYFDEYVYWPIGSNSLIIDETSSNIENSENSIYWNFYLYSNDYNYKFFLVNSYSNDFFYAFYDDSENGIMINEFSDYELGQSLDLLYHSSDDDKDYYQLCYYSERNGNAYLCLTNEEGTFTLYPQMESGTTLLYQLFYFEKNILERRRLNSFSLLPGENDYLFIFEEV